METSDDVALLVPTVMQDGNTDTSNLQYLMDDRARWKMKAESAVEVHMAAAPMAQELPPGSKAWPLPECGERWGAER